MIKYYCYMLINNEMKNYIGFTTDPKRRLRQHNKELKGGAKYTSKYKNWRYLFIISGFKSKQEALQCEWKLKHPPNKTLINNKYRGSYMKRIGNLDNIFRIGNKFTKNTIEPIRRIDIYFIYINIKYEYLFKNLKFDKNIIKLYTYILLF
jgi:structure-specific endonuclease subunit SLX1